jgi:hypothetical protein
MILNKNIRTVVSVAAFSLFGVLAVQPATARTSLQTPDYKVLAQAALLFEKTTDLFLRANQQGRTFRYVASANQTITVFDVTNNREPRQVNRPSLASNSNALSVKSVGNHLAVVAAAKRSCPRHHSA